MRIPGDLLEAAFKERVNRFRVRAESEARELAAYLPNPGRLRELLIPDTRLLLRPVAKAGRVTDFDVFAVMSPDGWVTLDSRLPNALFAEAAAGGGLPGFEGYGTIRAEVRFGSSVLDFLLLNGAPCLVEVKGCTLVREGRALFPDAPTQRGARHLGELAQARRDGYRACLVVVIQRKGAHVFTTNDATDPGFGLAAREAAEAGVEFLAYNTRLDREELRIDGQLPVDLQLGPRLEEGRER
jgi:sugar fermentation stimulation protein A